MVVGASRAGSLRAMQSGADLEAPESGESATAMEQFIRQHMTSILKPIAEHVDELQKRAEQLTTELGETKLQVVKNFKKLGDSETLLNSTVEELKELKQEESQLHHEVVLGGLVKRVTNLETGHQATREAMNKLEVRSDSISSSFQGLQQALDNTNSNLNRLQLKHWQTTNLAQRVESGLAEMKDENANLNEKHTGLVRSLQQTQQAVEAHRLAVGSLHATVDHHQKDTTEHIGNTKERLGAIDKLIAKMNQTLQLHSKELGSASNDMKQLMQNVGHLGDAIEGSKDGINSVQTLRQRLLVLEGGLGDLRQKVASELDRNVSGMVRDLAGAVRNNTANIAENRESLQALEAAHKEHHDRVTNLEARATEAEAKREDDLQRLSTAEAELGRVGAAQRESEGKLALARSDLDKTRAAQQQTARDLNETQANVHGLTGELGQTCEGMTKIAQRLDLAHEYLHGLGKGLQETHRSVVSGQDGMLPPKGGPGAGAARALPALSPPQPRAISAVIRGRCSTTPR